MSYVTYMYSKHTDDHRTFEAEIERRAAKIKPIRFWYDNAEKLPFEEREDGSRTRPITFVYRENFDFAYHGDPWYKKPLFKVDPYKHIRKAILSSFNPKLKPVYEWWELTATEPITVKAMDGTVTLAPPLGGQWKISFSKALRDTKYNSFFFEAGNEEPVAFMPANSVVLYTNKNKTDSGHLFAGREYYVVKEYPIKTA